MDNNVIKYGAYIIIMENYLNTLHVSVKREKHVAFME